MENSLMPQLRFPDFDDPWHIRLLEDIAIRGTGHTPDKKKPEYYNGGIKWVSLADSKYLDNGLISKTSIEISELGINNSSAVLHPKGTVLLSRDAGVGKSAVLGLDMAVSQHFVVWNGKKEELDNWFLYYKLQILKPLFERMAVGNTIKTIGMPFFKKLKLIIPSYSEQQKIAQFLITVDKRIQLQTRKKEQLELYKKGAMQKIFNREIRFKDKNGNDFPEWEEKKLGEVCEKKSSNISANSLLGNSGNYKIYGATGYLQSVNFYKEKKAYISIVKDGAGVGRVLICEPESSVLGTLDIIRSNQQSDLRFIYYFLSRLNFSKYAIGSTIPHIYFKDYSKEKIKLPVIVEQQKIAYFLTALDKKIEHTTGKIEKMKEWKRGLLQKMFV